MNKSKKYELMDPKIDFAFKQIFAGESKESKESKIVLIDLLNAILALEEHKKIINIIYLNPYTNKKYEEDKQSIMDIKVRTNDNELINIEMQIRNSDNYRRRSLYYWSTMYGEQIVEGEAYQELKKCIVINILNFNLITENDHYHSVFKVMEENKRIYLNHDLEIHYLELNKFLQKTINENFTKLEQWLIFIRDSANKNKRNLINQIQKENEVIKMAGKILEELSQDEKTRQDYLQRRKWYLDRVSSEKYLLSKGEEKGIKKEKVNTVKKSLKMGLSLEQIAQLTSLSLEEVEKIKADLQE